MSLDSRLLLSQILVVLIKKYRTKVLNLYDGTVLLPENFVNSKMRKMFIVSQT